MSGESDERPESAGCAEFDIATIQAAISGGLDTDIMNEVFEHLDACGVCQQVADAFLRTVDIRPRPVPEFLKGGEFELSEADRQRARQMLGSVMRRMNRGGESAVLTKRFGRHYEVVRILADGGMSQVFECVDARLNRRVAVKVLGDLAIAPNRLERLKREATIQAGLKHPNIVQLYGVEFDDFPPYIVMEMMDGGTLRDCIRSSLPGPRSAARIVASLAGALDVAHQQGVIHRDIKPSNVLLAEPFDPAPGGFERIEVKLADFGLARLSETYSSLTRSEILAGTPAYMSPEQTQGNSDRLTAQSDIYGLGVLLYELITGRPPLMTDNLELTLAMIREVLPVEPRQLQPNVSKDLNTICMKCLEKDPKTRYATAGELARDLENYLAGRGIAARPVGPVVRFGRWCRRNRSLSAWAALAVFSLVSLAVGGIASAVSQARLSETAQQEAEKALTAEKQARAAQSQAESMEKRAESARKDAEYSRQQAQNESDLSRSYFIASMRTLDQMARKIETARKAENPAAAIEPVEGEIRKAADTILSDFAKWPEILGREQADPLASLTPIQLERLFRDATALRDLGRDEQCKDMLRKLRDLFARTPVDHPDYESRLIIELKSRVYLSYILESEGNRDEAIRLLRQSWDRLIGSIDKIQGNRRMIIAFFNINYRLVILLNKAGRNAEADEILRRIEPISAIYHEMAIEAERIRPDAGPVPEKP